jgi:hypothetical protein
MIEKELEIQIALGTFTFEFIIQHFSDILQCISDTENTDLLHKIHKSGILALLKNYHIKNYHIHKDYMDKLTSLLRKAYSRYQPLINIKEFKNSSEAISLNGRNSKILPS